MNSILSSLVAEQQLLDQYLQAIPIREWDKATRFKSMTITDQVSYLAGSEDLAFNAIKKKGTFFDDYKGPNGLNKFCRIQSEKGQNMRPQDVIEWWRLSRAKIIELLADASPNRKIKWWKNEWDMKTFVSWKLSETWAHGLDIYDASNGLYEDTVRLEHVSSFSWSQIEKTSKLNKIKHKDLRIELIGPEYKVWQFGPEKSENIIKGDAGEWCRLTTGRVASNKKLSLSVDGPFAQKYVKFIHPMI